MLEPFRKLFFDWEKCSRYSIIVHEIKKVIFFKTCVQKCSSFKHVLILIKNKKCSDFQNFVHIWNLLNFIQKMFEFQILFAFSKKCSQFEIMFAIAKFCSELQKMFPFSKIVHRSKNMFAFFKFCSKFQKMFAFSFFRLNFMKCSCF